MNEATVPSLMSRVGTVISGHWETRQNPTDTQKQNIELAESEFSAFEENLGSYLDELNQYELDLEKAGAPWTPGRS